jgi:arginine/ornithine N-succinyltransferase beta subunit
MEHFGPQKPEKVQKKCKKSAFFVQIGLEREWSTFRLKKMQKSAKKCKICKKVQKITFFSNPWPGGLELPKKTRFFVQKFGQPKTRKSAPRSF